MVVAQQMQDAVHGEQVQLVVQAVPGLAGLLLRHRGAEHDITQQRRTWTGVIRPPSGVELVHRKAHHVGRARFVHPLQMQVRHCLDVHQQHRQLGERIDPELVQREPGDRDQRQLIDRHARFVGDFDTHQAGPASSGRIGPIGRVRCSGRAPGRRLSPYRGGFSAKRGAPSPERCWLSPCRGPSP